MTTAKHPAPDDTAVRVALWRALHVQVDAPPHALEDEVGLKLAAPGDGWQQRGDMSPFTRPSLARPLTVTEQSAPVSRRSDRARRSS